MANTPGPSAGRRPSGSAGDRRPILVYSPDPLLSRCSASVSSSHPLWPPTRTFEGATYYPIYALTGGPGSTSTTFHCEGSGPFLTTRTWLDGGTGLLIVRGGIVFLIAVFGFSALAGFRRPRDRSAGTPTA